MAWPSLSPSTMSNMSSIIYEHDRMNLNHSWSPYNKRANNHFPTCPDVDNLVTSPPFSIITHMEGPRQLEEFGSTLYMPPSLPELEITNLNFSIDPKDTALFDTPDILPQSFTSLWKSQAPSALSIHSSLSAQHWTEEMETAKKFPAFSGCCHECKPKNKQGTFMCGWENCGNPGPFTRKAVLMRHIDTQHVSPRGFVCFFESCGKSFNRKDNLDEHFRRVHWRPDV